MEIFLLCHFLDLLQGSPSVEVDSSLPSRLLVLPLPSEEEEEPLAEEEVLGALSVRMPLSHSPQEKRHYFYTFVVFSKSILRERVRWAKDANFEFIKSY